jgi:hypothetical protein
VERTEALQAWGQIGGNHDIIKKAEFLDQILFMLKKSLLRCCINGIFFLSLLLFIVNQIVLNSKIAFSLPTHSPKPYTFHAFGFEEGFSSAKLKTMTQNLLSKYLNEK